MIKNWNIGIGKKSMKIVYSDQGPEAWDTGMDSLGDIQSIMSVISSKGGASKFTMPASQLRQVAGLVYSVQTAIANEIKRREWKIYKGDAPVERDAKADALMGVMERPYPYGDESTLKETIVKSLDTWGAFVGVMVYAGNTLLGIVPQNYSRCRYHISTMGLLDYWTINEKRYPPEDVLYIHYPRVEDLYAPMSPIEAASAGVDINGELLDYSAKLIKNDARLQGLLGPEENVILDQAAMDKFKAWTKKLRGIVGGYEMAPARVKLIDKAVSPREMDFRQSREAMLNEICNVFGYSYQLLTAKDLNRAVMEALIFLTENRCLEPRMMVQEMSISRQVLRRFCGPDYWLTYDRKPFEFAEDKFKRQEMELRNGCTFPNEYREENGKDPVAWGNEPVKAVSPFAGQPYQDPAARPEPAPAKANIVLKIRAEVKRAYKSADERVWLWKSFDSTMRAVERPFTASVLRSFKRQAGQIADKIKALNASGSAIDASIFSQADAKKDMIKAVTEHVDNAVDSGRERAANIIQRDVPANDAGVKKFKAAMIAAHTEEITKTTAAKVADYVKGHAIGDPAKGLANVVTVSFDDFVEEITGLIISDSRAGMIAETMTLGGVNWGTSDGYESAGVEMKEWLSQQDGHVRGGGANDEYDHNLDGTIIKMTERFQTSASSSLDYPGDPEGDPGDIINCRCTILPAGDF